MFVSYRPEIRDLIGNEGRSRDNLHVVIKVWKLNCSESWFEYFINIIIEYGNIDSQNVLICKGILTLLFQEFFCDNFLFLNRF